MVRGFRALRGVMGGTKLGVLAAMLSCVSRGSQCCGEENQEEYSGNPPTAGFHSDSPEQRTRCNEVSVNGAMLSLCNRRQCEFVVYVAEMPMNRVLETSRRSVINSRKKEK